MNMDMKHLTGLLICLLTVLFHSSSIAQVYKSTDDQGNVTFSDTPAANANKIELPQANRVKAINVPPLLEVVTEKAEDYVVRISSPAHDSVIANGLVGFKVTTNISPALNREHQLRLTIDGEVHSSGRGSFNVSSINRGPHTLQVTLIDDKGTALAESAVVTVFAYRPSSSGRK